MQRASIVLAVVTVLASPAASSGAGTCPPLTLEPFIDVPCGIRLVGTTGGVPDPAGEFTITLYDVAHNPVPDCEVTIDFRDCFDARIATVQPWPGVQVTCLNDPTPYTEVRGVSDANGRLVMRIVGGATNTTSGAPAANTPCATIYAGGDNVRVRVAIFDENGQGGVNPADLSLWIQDSFDGDYEARSDFNCTGTVNPADMAMLLGVMLGGGSTASATNYCN